MGRNHHAPALHPDPDRDLARRHARDPAGTYAYFVTIDFDNLGNLVPAFPYVLGKTFFGTLQPGNTGPNSGHNTISETVTVFTSTNKIENDLKYMLYPNPASSSLQFFLMPSFNSNMTVRLFNNMGAEVKRMENVQTSIPYSFDVSELPSGMYVVRVDAGDKNSVSKILIAR